MKNKKWITRIIQNICRIQSEMMHRRNYLQFIFFTMDINDTFFEKECENIMKGVELL